MVFWQHLSENRPQTGDHLGRAARYSDDPALGVLAHGRHARDWGFLPAVHGSGRLGCHSSPPVRELAPALARGTFIGLAYQTGNLIASINLPLEIWIKDHFHGNFGMAIACVVFVVFIAVAIITSLGVEKREVEFVEVE